MTEIINPKETTRAMAFELWMKAPNPMVTFFKTLDVTNLIKMSRRRKLKFNMLLDYCIGKAASSIKEFYILPFGGGIRDYLEEHREQQSGLIKFDNIAVNTIVKNKTGEVSSCDILFSEDLEKFNDEYIKYTNQVAATCQDRDLSSDCMVIGTSAIIDTELDGAVGMNSGIFNNPFIIWGRYCKRFFYRGRFNRYTLALSFQFHHTQMDGAHAGEFLGNLEREINTLK